MIILIVLINITIIILVLNMAQVPPQFLLVPLAVLVPQLAVLTFNTVLANTLRLIVR